MRSRRCGSAARVDGCAPIATRARTRRNGAAGLVTAPDEGPVSVMGFTIKVGKIVEIDILADAARLARLDLVVLDE
jgi:hypothetical protein